ncbi:MAG: endonuclease/exonuclease/phosphatase family protein [Bdellovibrionales bacterium]
MSHLKVITYNTWHGLNGKGTLEFGSLEPAGRKQLRHDLQLQELKKKDADILFLQEVCPLQDYSQEFAEYLEMDEVHQLDQGGIKLAGRGIPFNLSTGLTILAKRRFEIKKLSGVKLSGGVGLLHDWFSFQYSEFRYALFAEIQFPTGLGLLINTHLHHAPVLDDEISSELKQLVDTGKVQQWQSTYFQKALERGRARRLQEGEALLQAIREIRSKYQVILLCGDLNDLPHSELLTAFKEQSFRDVVPSANSTFLTWNHEKNEENHFWTQKLNPPISNYGSSHLEKLYRKTDHKPRRIDYILTAGNVRTMSAELVMNQPQALPGRREMLIGSDHFGMQAELELQF